MDYYNYWESYALICEKNQDVQGLNAVLTHLFLKCPKALIFVSPNIYLFQW